MNFPITNIIAREILNVVRDNLLGIDGITDEMIEAHLNDYNERHQKLQSLNDVYRAILFSARNRQRVSNAITIERFNNLDIPLFGFDHNQVLKQ